MSNIKIRYSKESMEITHPTGVRQVLDLRSLEKLKRILEDRETELTEGKSILNAHIAEVNKLAGTL